MSSFYRFATLRLLLAPLAVAFAAACHDTGPTGVERNSAPERAAFLYEKEPLEPVFQTGTCTPTRFELDSGGATNPLRSGTTVQLTIKVYGAGNCRVYPSGGVTWSVADSTIAAIVYPNQVGPAQTLRFRLAGTTTLTVSYASITNNYNFTVVPGDPARVEVTPATFDLQIGATRQLAGMIYDAAGNKITNRGLTWTSSNTAVATIYNATAYAAGVQAGPSTSSFGQATITATVSGSTVRGTATVNVNAPECYCPPGVSCTCSPAGGIF
jgi:hypothetical protein